MSITKQWDSKLGWIVVGNIAVNNSPEFKSQLSSSISLHSTLQLESLMKKFWEIEELPDEGSNSLDDRYALKQFQETHERDVSGRFIVRLPKKQFNNDFGDTFSLAYKRFSYLERKFKQNSIFKNMYFEFINEYLSLNHMEVIPSTENSNSNFYLPHHGVLKECSLTTKLRVVFDESAHTMGHPSLNDILHNGLSFKMI